MAKPKKIDIIAKIYNGIIKGIAIGKTLVALQGSARAGKSFQIMIFLIQCALEPNIVNKLNMANYISRLKAWKEKLDKVEGETEPQQPVILEKVHISVVRLAMPSIKRSIFRDFVEIMNLMGIYDPRRMNKTEMIYTFENGSIIEFFATADNEQKVRGSKRDILFINEANEVSEWEFTQLRMRSMSFSIVDFNPSFTEEHWLFKKLDDPRTYHFVSTFIDNPFLPDAVKEEIMSYKYTNPALWKIFGLGEFAIVEGLVYPKETWDVVELTDIPIDVKVEKRIGIDVGFSGKGDPTAAVLCYYANINGIKHMWMEELVYDKGLNEKQLAFRLKPYNHIKKYIDSANPLYIQNLEDSGMSLVYPVVKYANSVVDGINKVQGYKLHVIRGSVNIIKELNNYCWMKDRHEAFTNTPIDKFNHCLDYQTLIPTLHGPKRICDIQVGDMVYNSGGIFPVLKVFKNGVKEVWDMELTTDDGQKVEISITPNHKIKTTQGWKQLQELTVGDKVYLLKNSMENFTSCETADTFSMDQKGFIGKYGSFITEKFLKAITSITKTVTSRITTLITLFAYHVANILSFICNKTCKIQSLLQNKKNAWTMQEYTQVNGMGVKKEESGIVKTEKELEQLSKRENTHVLNAEKNIGQSLLENTDSVLTDAHPHGIDKADTMTRQESVNIAEKSLQQTSTERQSFVACHALVSIDLKKKRMSEVYNLMVDEVHEYVADNLLVSNCMDAMRYSVMSERSGRATKRRYTKDELNFGF